MSNNLSPERKDNTALAMCAISGLAYNVEKDNQQFKNALPYGWTVKDTQITHYRTLGVDVHQSVLVEYDDCLVVGFAGSLSPVFDDPDLPLLERISGAGVLDWAVNADAALIHYGSSEILDLPGIEMWAGLDRLFPQSWRVHRGFMRSVILTLLGSVGTFEYIEGTHLLLDVMIKSARKSRPIYITGHSQGGAMAAVSVPLFKYIHAVFSLLPFSQDDKGWHWDTPSIPEINLYTFAAPRQGNMDFATGIATLTQENMAYANWLDPVPQIPLALNTSSLYGIIYEVSLNFTAELPKAQNTDNRSASAIDATSIVDSMFEQTLKMTQANATQRTQSVGHFNELGFRIRGFATQSNGSFKELLQQFLKKVFQANIAGAWMEHAVELILKAASWYYWVTIDTTERKLFFAGTLYLLHYDLLKQLIPANTVFGGHLPLLNEQGLDDVTEPTKAFILQLFKDDLDLDVTLKENAANAILPVSANLIGAILGIILIVYRVSRLIAKGEQKDLLNYAGVGRRVYITDIRPKEYQWNPLFVQHSIKVYLASLKG